MTVCSQRRPGGIFFVPINLELSDIGKILENGQKSSANKNVFTLLPFEDLSVNLKTG